MFNSVNTSFYQDSCFRLFCRPIVRFLPFWLLAQPKTMQNNSFFFNFPNYWHSCMHFAAHKICFATFTTHLTLKLLRSVVLLNGLRLDDHRRIAPLDFSPTEACIFLPEGCISPTDCTDFTDYSWLLFSRSQINQIYQM